MQASKFQGSRVSWLMLLLAFSAPSYAESRTIVTTNFIIVIVEHCEQGFLGCKDVSFVEVNKISGDAVKAKGIATVRTCSGTSDPCESTGWIFISGTTTYVVTQELLLTVSRGGRLMYQEQGTDVDDLVFKAKK